MSFLYNYRTKQPQIWTYPIFVIIAAAMLYGFFFYGELRSRDPARVQQNAEPERLF